MATLVNLMKKHPGMEPKNIERICSFISSLDSKIRGIKGKQNLKNRSLYGSLLKKGESSDEFRSIIINSRKTHDPSRFSIRYRQPSRKDLTRRNAVYSQGSMAEFDLGLSFEQRQLINQSLQKGQSGSKRATEILKHQQRILRNSQSDLGLAYQKSTRRLRQSGSGFNPKNQSASRTLQSDPYQAQDSKSPAPSMPKNQMINQLKLQNLPRQSGDKSLLQNSSRQQFVGIDEIIKGEISGGNLSRGAPSRDQLQERSIQDEITARQIEVQNLLNLKDALEKGLQGSSENENGNDPEIDEKKTLTKLNSEAQLLSQQPNKEENFEQDEVE